MEHLGKFSSAALTERETPNSLAVACDEHDTFFLFNLFKIAYCIEVTLRSRRKEKSAQECKE